MHGCHRTTMPQIRYYHHGRYYRPARSMPLLPPLSLVPAVDPSKHHSLKLGCTDDDEEIVRRWRSNRDKEFRWMVRYIGESLTGENIADLRFLCRDHIQPPEVLRQTMKGVRLMTILERHRLLAENSLFFLQTLLYYIARPDLYELVVEYRTKRQNDMRKIGVEIMYDMNQPNEKGPALSKKLKSFRKSLKPRSRFNTVDVMAMSKRMSELKMQMQSQLPKTIDHGYTNSVLSSTTALSDDSSEWEDVDTDDDEGNDDDQSSRGVDDSVNDRIRNESTSAIKSSVEKKDSIRLPQIKPKRKIEVTIKTGLEGHSDDDHGKNGTIEDGSQSGIHADSSQVNRIQGPSKPIHNFTHRSSEFLDMKVDGKQTYNDDDVIACVRDVNKLPSARVVDALNKKKMEDAVPLAALTTQRKSLTTTSVKPIPVKFKVLRRRYRKESPGRRAMKAIKRHKATKPLPQISKSEPIQTEQRSVSLAEINEIKTTRNAPVYTPQKVNFLPDIYDKYARKSVSTASTKASTKTTRSRKSIRR